MHLDVKKTWSAANDTCVYRSGWLVTLSSSDEAALVMEWLAAQGGLHEDRGPYIGLYRSGDAGESASTFRWVQAGDNPSGAYKDWAAGYPSFVSGSENCVHLSDEGLWENSDCDDQHSFVCEAEGIVVDMTKTKTKSSGNSSNAVELALSLGLPLCAVAGGLIFYFLVVADKSTDSHRPWAAIGGGRSKDSEGPFSAVDDESEGASSHALVGTEMVELSRFDPTDGSSPEETMEIQLQMRSYTSVYD